MRATHHGHRPRVRSPHLLWVLPAVALMLVSAAAFNAGAASSEVRLTGDNNPNFFFVQAATATSLEFCSDTVPCFTRLRTEVSSIVIDAFNGDDLVVVSHANGFVSNGQDDLPLTFVAGTGADELVICDDVPEACTAAATTEVLPGPEPDELRVIQCEGRGHAGGRCESDWEARGRTLRVTVRGAARIRDLTPGPATAVGSAGDDVVTLGSTERIDMTGALVPAGEVLVGSSAPYVFAGKDSLAVESGAGADRIVVEEVAGLAASPRSCAPAGLPSASFSLRSDTGDDAIALAEAPASRESVTLQPRPGGGTVTGAGVAPALDLVGIDRLDLAQQPADGDELTIRGTGGDDAVELSTGAGQPTALVVAGQLDAATAAFALPAVTVTGDGSGPLGVRVEAAAGADRVVHRATAGDDAVTVGPPGSGSPCAGSIGDCYQVAVDGLPHHVLTSVDVEGLDVETADGDDTLAIQGDRLATLTWRGGEGADALTFTGTGQPVTLDLGAGTLQQTGGGVVTAKAVELLTADAAGRNLLVVGTSGADHIRYRPADAAGGVIVADGDARTVRARNVAGTLAVDPVGGSDTVTVEATAASETIAVTRGASVVAQVGDTLPLRVPATGEGVAVAAAAGDDRFVVSGEGGPSAITLDGGSHTGGDRLSFAAALADAAVALGATPGSGTLAAGGPAIAFTALEDVDVEGDDAGVLTVHGSDGNDALVQTGNTVTAGRGTTVRFTRFPTLAIGAGAGDDQIWTEPATASADVAELRVDGGSTGTNTVAVRGTALGEMITYRATGPTSAQVALSGAPLVDLAGAQHIRIDGATAPPSGDTLVFTTPTMDGTVVVEAGSSFDAGLLGMRDASGAATAVPPLQYGGLGAGAVVVDGSQLGGAPADDVVVHGQADDDVFVVDSTTSGFGPVPRVRLDTRLAVSLPGVRTVQLDGFDGADTFRVPANHMLPGAGAHGIAVAGGGPSDGDVLVASVAGTPAAVDLVGGTLAQTGHRPIAFGGVARVQLDAGSQPLTVLGSSGPDDLHYQPTSASGGSATVSGSDAVLAFSNAALLTVDPREGADRVTVAARSTDDAISVERGAVTTVAVSGLLPGRIGEATEALRVEGREGADVLAVTGAGGPPSLTLAGGAPDLDGDVLTVSTPHAEVAFAADPTGGVLATPGGSIAFTTMDVVDLDGDGSGTLTVRGTDGADTLTIGDPDVPRVRVNGGAPVRYRGYRGVTLDGGAGVDRTSISYARLGPIERLRVIGGTAADDHVTITDTAGSTRSFAVRPTAPDSAEVTVAGLPAVDLTGVMSLVINGAAGNDEVKVLTPDGAQDVRIAAGPAADGGTVRVASLLPVTFADVGVDGDLTINEGGSPLSDSVALTASTAGDTFSVVGSASQVQLDGFVPVAAFGTRELVLRGGEGSDTYVLTGPLPWDVTAVEGGGPDQGDRLRLDAPVGEVTVDLEAATLAGYGGVVQFPGLRYLHTHLASQTLQHVGTARDDAYCYDPQAPRDGRLHVVGAPAGGTLASVCLPDARALTVLHTFVDVGRFAIDPAAGVDQLIVNGTTAADVLSVTSTQPRSIVSLNPQPGNPDALRLPVEVVSANTENVSIAGDEGVDIIDVSVHEYEAPLFTVYGEGPETPRNGDQLHVRDLTGGGEIRKTSSQGNGPAGTVSVHYRRYSGILVRVDYDGIEDVAYYTRKR